MTITCPICAEASVPIRELTLLGKHRSTLYQCKACGYAHHPEPAWLEEAYAEAINGEDTGLLQRNEANRNRLVWLLRHRSLPPGPYIDLAAGYGVLVRMMRDAGFDFRWSDPYCQNIFAKRFEADDARFRCGTAFEVLEHLQDPVTWLRDAIDAHGLEALVCSTELIARPAPHSWGYYGPEHGQHIAFHTVSSLEGLAGAVGWQCTTDGRAFHILSARKVPERVLARACSRPAALLWKFRRRPSLTLADHDRMRERADANDGRMPS